jgi:hypothetical protein
MATASTLTTASAALSSAIKLKLTSHRLSERRCQVKFLAQHKDSSTPTRGHMLVDPSLSLREVAQIIRQRMVLMQQHGAMHLSSFYCISDRENGSGFIFFES